MNKVPNYLKYWGKINLDSSKSKGAECTYHLLGYHSLDVAAVCYELMNAKQPLAQDFADILRLPIKVLKDLFAFVVSLHDLGKFTSAFQALAPCHSPNLITPCSRKEYDGSRFRHDRLGAYFWREIRNINLFNISGYDQLSSRERGAVDDSLLILMDCALGHHGQPVDHGEMNKIRRSFTETANLDAAIAFTEEVVRLFNPTLPLSLCCDEDWRKQLKLVSWHFAGIVVLSDWIASDRLDFPYRSDPIPLKEYWSIARNKAVRALHKKGLTKRFLVKPFNSIRDSFSFIPTPLQTWAEFVPVNSSPQLFILEDVTGAGKTEAALALTQRLMAADAADGFYFGLPTMATSNAMFDRVAEHYSQMYESEDIPPSIILAHGAREMNEAFRGVLKISTRTDEGYEYDVSKAVAGCEQWFADSRKKALLAPVGVGTIDQVLIAVLPRRHQSLRVLGLHRKVLIFDEIHAADEYMFELLESLLQLHLHQGGSAILLTATLPLQQRQRLIAIWHKAAYLKPELPQNTDFPLATRVTVDPSSLLLEESLKSRPDVSREVAVRFVHSFDDCVAKIIAAAHSGQCVVWVRNSVDDAVAAHRKISELLKNSDDALLFHSRFVLDDRKRIEDCVLDVFGKKSTGKTRRGKVLVATQVFQESLDVDCDFLVSDLCPMDDLIQRTGRLHRHTRNKKRLFEHGIKDDRPAPEICVYTPCWDDNPSKDWLSKDFRNTAFVYRSPGRLWLGMKKLRELGAIRMPAEARQLIEAVYGENVYDQIPQSLIQAENECIGSIRGQVAKAKSIVLDWQKYGYCTCSGYWHEDNVEISTRFSDIEYVEVVLLKTTDNGRLTLWVEDEKFAVQLSTVKLIKHTCADKLQPFPDSLEDQRKILENHYHQLKFRQCWLPEMDPLFDYQPTRGFCKRQEQQKEEM